MLPGAINATEIRARCNEGLATMSGEVDVQFIALFSGFHRKQGPCLCPKSRVESLEMSSRYSDVILPGAINATEIRAR